MRDFHKLKVWEKAHNLTLSVYQISKNFPWEELYGLSNQIRQSSASMPTNIAEGYGRNSDAEMVQFPGMVTGSASELEEVLHIDSLSIHLRKRNPSHLLTTLKLTITHQ